MRIGFDAKRALNNGTGLGNHSRILLNALMRDFPENEYLLFTPKINEALFHQVHGNFKMLLPETKFEKAFNALWRSYGIVNDIDTERLNIYHGLSNEIPFGLSHTKSVVTIHDLIFLKHTEQYPFIDRQFYQLKTKYAANKANRVIAVSKETKDDLIEYYKIPEKKVEIIYQSVSPLFLKNLEDTDEAAVRSKFGLGHKYILNVGSFFPRKNQLTLLAAFNRIKNQIEHNLALVGNTGFVLTAIKKYIADNQLANRVHLLTSVNNHDLAGLYKGAELFVYPSLFEGFGLPVLEALHSKTPVIATNYGAIAEAAGQGSVFVNPQEQEDIADKILQVLKDEALKNKMKEQGYLHAQTMSNKIFAQQTMELYKSL